MSENHLDINIYKDIRDTLAKAREKTYAAINYAMVEAYWEIGRQIDVAVGERAEYGKGLLKYLARQLTEEFGKGFDESSLRRMRQFFKTFPIRATLWHELSWSHYRLLMKIDDEERRTFYARECAESSWSVRQLERQINSFFYERLLATQQSPPELWRYWKRKHTDTASSRINTVLMNPSVPLLSMARRTLQFNGRDTVKREK